jgi:3-dehydroquinate dehydratase-1
LRLQPGAVDVLELRVDHFAADPDALLAAAGKLPAPLIVTARHPREGGFGNLGAARREQLYWQFLPFAAYLDVELRSVERMGGVLAAARQNGVQVIVSDHHFQRTPSASVLHQRWKTAIRAGASIVKVAGRIDRAADLGRLLTLMEHAPSGAVSVMGMGPLGKVSRLLFARLGSCLNYGYLHAAQVPGQWEATELKKRLVEVFAE